MAGSGATRSLGLLLGAAALAACSGGSPDPGVAALRAKVEAQAAEIDALKKASRDMDARARGLEEALAASKGAPAAKSAPAPAGPAPADAPAADAASTPTTEAIAAYLETEQGRQKLVEATEAAEKRRTERTEQEQRERMMGLVKERVTGYLTEQLNLDSAQQQAVLAVAVETTERMGEIWKGLRENRGDPTAMAQVREKTNEIRQQAVEKIQQALTVDQFNKFQEILNEGGGGFLMGGGRGGMGGPPAGGGAGGAGGGQRGNR